MERERLPSGFSGTLRAESGFAGMRDGRFKTAVRTFIRIKTKIDGTTEDSIENILISHITHSIVIVKLSNIIDIIKKNITKRFFSILSYIRR
mgnify:CR=1 FL=1